jgi:hypothetical protein
MVRKEEACPNIIPIMLIIILAVSTGLASTLTGFGKLGIAQGQGDNSTSSSSLTPEQRAAMCEPGDKHVNTTESKICGIPKHVPSNATTSTPSEENTTPEGITPPEQPSED